MDPTRGENELLRGDDEGGGRGVRAGKGDEMVGDGD